jgi:hypothetical protein
MTLSLPFIGLTLPKKQSSIKCGMREFSRKTRSKTMNTMEYKGFAAKVEYSEVDACKS